MNRVTAPSFAPASFTNFAISAVRSVKPRPDVCTVSSEDTMMVARTVDDGERESDFGEVMNPISVVPAKAGTHTPRPLDFGRSELISSKTINGGGYGSLLSQGRRSKGPSNLAGDVLLHPVSHLDQPPPRLLEKRHHAIHVAVARQRNFNLALAIGHLRLVLFQRVRLRQRLVDLAGDGRLARRQLRFELFIVGLQPANFRIECCAFVGHGVAGPARAGVTAGRNGASTGIKPEH